MKINWDNFDIRLGCSPRSNKGEVLKRTKLGSMQEYSVFTHIHDKLLTPNKTEIVLLDYSFSMFPFYECKEKTVQFDDRLNSMIIISSFPQHSQIYMFEIALLFPHNHDQIWLRCYHPMPMPNLSRPSTVQRSYKSKAAYKPNSGET